MDIFYIFLDKFDFAGSKREKEHAAGLFLIKYAAESFYRLDNSEIEIINDKPCFKYNKRLHFSVSHTKNSAAVCFDKNPIGFDIEYIKPRNYMPIAERMNFYLKENTLEEFYKCWTRYEAEYKLQQKAENTKTEIFEEKYAISAASASCDEIIFNFYPAV